MDNTTDTILEYFSEVAREKKQLNPKHWMDAAMKLNVLLIDEEKKLQDLRRQVAEIKLKYLEGMKKKSVAEAEMRAEVTPEYHDMRLQEMKVSRAEEFVRLAKLNSRTAQGI